MSKAIFHSIPNTLTCLNLFSGCMATVVAFQGEYQWALFLIVCSAVFDFFDGMAARLLNAHSPIGKDLDSLADDVSFGVAPSAIVYSFLEEICIFDFQWLPYAAFLISVFSALRLAKFNNDTRQTSSFVGLPVPANALFWASLVVGFHDWIYTWHPLAVVALIGCSCFLLVCELPMFSLKFKSLAWRDNRVSFLFLLVCLPLLLLGVKALAIIVLWYILLSCVTAARASRKA